MTQPIPLAPAVVVDSAAPASTLQVLLSAQPEVDYVLVRAAATPTWHLFSRQTAADATGGRLSEPIDSVLYLDSMNEIAEIPMPDRDLDAIGYGVVVLGTEVVGLSLRAVALGGDSDLSPSDSDLSDSGEFAAAASIVAPTQVAPGAIFEINPKIERSESPNLFLEELPDDMPVIEFDVTVNAPLADGEKATKQLAVDRTTLEHEPVSFRLQAPFDSDSILVEAEFSFLGMPVSIVSAAVHVGEAGPTSTSSHQAQLMPVPSAVPDMVITIARTNRAGGNRYQVQMASKHARHQPAITHDIDWEPDQAGIGTRLVALMDSAVPLELTKELIGGVATTLSDALGDAFWRTFDEIMTRRPDDGDPPSVLLITTDTQIPWELTLMPRPARSDIPAFLGAQCRVGRWLRLPGARPSPDATMQARSLGVIVGHYQRSTGIAPLPEAEAEAEALRNEFGAVVIPATADSFDGALRGEAGEPPSSVDAIHFAGHGEHSPTSNTVALLLEDGYRVPAIIFATASGLEHRDGFLFLNACRAGTSIALFGQPAGAVGSAVRAGYKGVVAPYWSVSDGIAREVSESFYEAQRAGVPVAEFLRQARSRFMEDEHGRADATWLAYTFYGHPELSLNGPWAT